MRKRVKRPHHRITALLMASGHDHLPTSLRDNNQAVSLLSGDTWRAQGSISSPGFIRVSWISRFDDPYA